MKITKIVAALGFAVFVNNSAWADYRDDIGFTRLQNQLGAAMPTGAGVNVTQVEAIESTNALGNVYAPDTGNAEFANKTISFPKGNPSGAYSGHATYVGQLFYGNNSSMASGITSIQAYDVNSWLNNLGTNTGSRIANHSWIGSGSVSTDTSNILRLVDRLVYYQQYIQVVAMGNGGGNAPLLGSAYNVISVGMTNGTSGSGSVGVTGDSTYVAGRAAPDIVAPGDFTSFATPIVSSAAALLVQAGHQGVSNLSKGSTIVSGVGTVYDAERSETIKAALMAGADRVTANTSTAANITDYGSAGHLTANGLDGRYGAGQVNIYNSYQIIAAGEQKSGTAITATGFDFNGSFGGANGSQRTANYDFTAHGQETLSASLVWNLGVSPNNLTTTFHNLELSLFDLTTNSTVAYSASLLDNTQNIWLALIDGDNYELRISALDPQNFSWGYALAWDIQAVHIQAVPIPAAFWLFGSALVGFGCFGRKRSGREARD